VDDMRLAMDFGKIESHSKMALMHLYIWYGFNMYVTLPLITFHPARNEYYSLQNMSSPSKLLPLIPN
jgi:hypothetical protein